MRSCPSGALGRLIAWRTTRCISEAPLVLTDLVRAHEYSDIKRGWFRGINISRPEDLSPRAHFAAIDAGAAWGNRQVKVLATG